MNCDIEVDDRFLVSVDYSFAALSEIIRFETYLKIAPRGQRLAGSAMKFHCKVVLSEGMQASEGEEGASIVLIIKQFQLKSVQE